MKSESSPIRLSEELESMATLVERGRRLGRFWPATVEPPAVEPKPYPRPGQPPRRPSYRIGAREARLFGEVPE